MTAHCRHCDPDCAGETIDDPDESIYHFAPDEAFIWSSDYGCPVCRNVKVLRQMVDEEAAKDDWQAWDALMRAVTRIDAGEHEMADVTDDDVQGRQAR